MVLASLPPSNDIPSPGVGPGGGFFLEKMTMRRFFSWWMDNGSWQGLFMLVIVGVAVWAAFQIPDHGLLSGLLGSIIGALGTVYATKAMMAQSVAETEKQRELDRESEYKARLRALKAEVEFNVQQPLDNSWYYISYATSQWQFFSAHLYHLNKETSRLLVIGYTNASSFPIARDQALEGKSTRALKFAEAANRAFQDALATNGLDA